MSATFTELREAEVPIKRCCALLGRARATHYRHVRGPQHGPRPAQCRAPGTCGSQARSMTSATAARHIGILLFDDMEELDAVGPWEVFAWWTRHFPEDGFAATTFSADGRPVTCEKSLVLHPHHSLASVPPLAVLLHPGGDGTQQMLEDSAHLQWLRDQRNQVPLITSVCTGSIVLAAAGLLHGRPRPAIATR